MTEKKRKKKRGFNAALGSGVAIITALATVLSVAILAAKPTVAKAPEPQAVQMARPAWLGGLVDGLRARGFSWLDIGVDGKIATVTGKAPDVDSQRFGFEAAESAIQGAPESAGAISVVVDATELVGGGASVGGALMRLSANPAAAECQTAFVDTMQGRTINFASGSATLTEDNKRLLDALTAVALRCAAYDLEIGGHTDAMGSPQRNLALSQSRAESVSAYLAQKGVAAEQLKARGFGSSQPREAGRTAQANAANRRIEFTVQPR